MAVDAWLIFLVEKRISSFSPQYLKLILQLIMTDKRAIELIMGREGFGTAKERSSVSNVPVHTHDTGQ